jgi:CHASE2 domain-containing sensor protein
MHDFQDAFISYGRADSKSFAIKLHQHLLAQSIKAWIDQNDIPLAVDYQNQIDGGIEKADNLIYIISPHSVNSPYCLKELELALKYCKRIIPVMHVERISHATWQERYPAGTEVQWQDYQAAGLHDSFQNMHPAIRKINWVYCREGLEHFEDALTQLLNLFERQRDYIKKHTEYLNRALAWERRQQQSAYLLTGEDCQIAEGWLKTRFQKEQPPCIPTELHCEYITESIKNANNLMTQVFLCYAEEDLPTLTKIRHSLMREAFTVWTNRTDIQTGVAFQAAIDRGIEEADQLVYLLSPHSLQSHYCQHEVDYALSLNKRIIPLLTQAIQPGQIPAKLRAIQYIDLSDNLIEADYQQDENQLIRTLRSDATYFEQHKLLLAKAMKWQRQNRNPSLLLGGYNLRQAEAWLKVERSQVHYLPIQQEFVQASRDQPLDRSLDVFIAYSRVDSDFTRRLNDALQIQGQTTWFDQESIASGTDFQQEIFRGIAASNNFLFIISPSSVNSPYCADEVEYARKLNKRIITVLHRPVATQALPSQLAGIQWIDFNRQNSDFLTNLGELIRTLETDEDHARSHTRLLLRSMEWEAEKHDSSFLLRGKELKDAEQWLQAAAHKQPQAADRQRQYITISRRSPLRRPKRRTVGLASVGAGLLVIGARLLGGLQPIELAAYDQFMRWKPSEAKDQRLLLVEIDDVDIKTQNKSHPVGVRGGSLPDPTLAKLLDKLQSARPQVIGLDLYRDFATDQPRLARQFKRTANLVFLCKLRAETVDGVNPPPELPENQFVQRLGFSDLAFDEDFAFDKGITVRRQVLVNEPTPPECQTDRSFSLATAQQYLDTQSQPYRPPFDANGTFLQALQFGQTRFPRLNPFAAVYFSNNIGGGYQTMLNFRSYRRSPQNFIDRVKLRDVLADQVPIEKIRDRIVLIGVTSRASVNDYVMTPVGEMSGVMIQAQMISQLTSAVMDRRLLIWWWPFWGDMLWVMGWAGVGGIMVWAIQRPRIVILVGMIVLGALGLICYGLFVFQGGWVPLVPSAIALVTAGCMTLAGARWLEGPRRSSRRLKHADADTIV